MSRIEPHLAPVLGTIERLYIHAAHVQHGDRLDILDGTTRGFRVDSRKVGAVLIRFTGRRRYGQRVESETVVVGPLETVAVTRFQPWTEGEN